VWDPAQYQRFAGERGRPFADLLARVDATRPERVVDLGCGPGTLTAGLRDRWPTAAVTGVDSSPDMVGSARTRAEAQPEEPGSLDVVEADLRAWEPDGPVDVLVSNATLQWVPGHLGMLGRLVGWLAPGGWLAFQVPGNFREPSHVILHELTRSARWRDRVGPGRVALPSSHEPVEYLEALTALACAADVWETTYLHVLPGEDAVLHWVTGTGASPVLDALDDDERAAFLTEYGAALREAYPRRAYGTVLPFRRVFAVARRPEETA
jgi:trans-aconitate 2-methyltransferase